MSEKTFRLTRRRALGGLLTVGVGSAAAGAGTFALFSDEETSSGNTVQAGTLDLTGEDGGSFTFSVGGNGLAPGDDAGSATATLENNGNVDALLDIDISLSENDTSGDPTETDLAATETAEAFEVAELTYGQSDLTSSQVTGTTDPANLASVDSDVTASSSYTSLADLAAADITDLADPTSGTDFVIELVFREEAGNGFQADGVDAEFTFTLNQDTS